MQELEREQRQRVVAAAQSWLGTPYHTEGRIKGVGVDCATLLAGVAEDSGLTGRVHLEHYPHDWHLHRDDERYLGIVLQFCREIKGPPRPGDIALWKFGRSFSHGAIVVEWPRIIHAYVKSVVCEEDVDTAHWLKFIGENGPDVGRVRPVKFFSFWHGDE